MADQPSQPDDSDLVPVSGPSPAMAQGLTGTSQPHDSDLVTPDEYGQEKYGTLPQKILGGAEQVAQGVAGPIAPMLEEATGLTRGEDIRGRAKELGVAAPVLQGVGLAGSTLIPGLGEEALAGKVESLGQHAAAALIPGASDILESQRAIGEAGKALKAAQVSGEGIPEAQALYQSAKANLASQPLMTRIAATGVKTGAEMAALQASDEFSKMVEGDPDQTLGSAAVQIGLSGIMGGAGGAVLGSVAPLWDKAMNRSGIQKLAKDYMGELAFPKPGDMVENAVGELNDRIASTDQLIRGGLKQNLINALSQDVGPESLQSHIESIEKMIEDAPSALKKEPIFQDAVQNWKSKVYTNPEIHPVTPPETVSPNYEGIPPTVLKAKGALPPRIAQMIKAGSEAAESNLSAANAAGFNPYETVAPRPTPSDPSTVFQATENLKRQLQEWGQYNKALVPVSERPFRDAAQGVASDLRQSLEDKKVWGAAGDAQARYNKAISPLFDVQKEAKTSFMSKLEGDHVADPKKITSFLNQTEKGKAGLRTNYASNYLDQTDKAFDVVNDLYRENKMEPPFEDQVNPAITMRHLLNTEPTSGIQLARWVKRNGAASLAANAAGHIGGELVGGALGFMAGHALLGAWMGDKILKPVITAIAKPFAEKSIDSGAARAATDYLGNAIRGQKILSDAVESFFKPGALVIGKDLIPDQASRDRLDKSLEHAQNPQNLLQAGGSLGHYLPDHATAASATASRAANYLASIKPSQKQTGLMDDPTPIDKNAQSRYERALDVAQQPLVVLKHAKNGTLLPQDIQALDTIYPKLRQVLAHKLGQELVTAKTNKTIIPYRQKLGAAAIMGQPVDSMMSQPSMLSIMATNSASAPPPAPMGKHKSVSKNTASSMLKVNSLYQTPEQSRAASRTRDIGS